MTENWHFKIYFCKMYLDYTRVLPRTFAQLNCRFQLAPIQLLFPSKHLSNYTSIVSLTKKKKNKKEDSITKYAETVS